MAVNLPLTGTGQSTASVATEQIGGVEYQFVKLVSGTAASTVVGSAAVLGTVAVSSGQILSTGTIVGLGIGSSANMVGQFAISTGNNLTLGAGSSASVIGQVAISTGNSLVLSSGALLSTANIIALGIGSSANIIGSAVIAAGSSAVMMGQVAVSTGTLVSLNLGTSATYNFMQSIPFSSGNAARTSVSTTVDTSVIAANANRKALFIANLSTSQIVALGFTTAAVTTALASVSAYLQPNSQLYFGLGGNMPLFLGPVRGINISSTTVAGGVAVTEFT